jgi:NAD(P)-dependent dehydrogenase (short-subunit alcohol dehydrogenase family)
LPVTSGYSASKFAVVGLSEALHRELLGTGVSVSCLNPGSVKTDFWDEEHIPRKRIPPLVRYSPKLSTRAVARWVVLCIWLPIPTLTFPFFVGILAKLNAIWVRLGDLLLWKWFFPIAGLLVLIRLLIKYLL